MNGIKQYQCGTQAKASAWFKPRKPVLELATIGLTHFKERENTDNFTMHREGTTEPVKSVGIVYTPTHLKRRYTRVAKEILVIRDGIPLLYGCIAQLVRATGS